MFQSSRRGDQKPIPEASRDRAVVVMAARRLAPAARHLAETHGLDVGAIAGTGRKGLVTKGDVLAALAGGAGRRSGGAPVGAAACVGAAAPAAAPAAAVAAARAAPPARPPAPTRAAAAPAAPPAAAAAAAPARPAAAPGAAAVAAAAATPPPPPGGGGRRVRGHTDTPATQIRKIIAARLTEAKGGIPHLYASSEVGLDAVLALRAQLKARGVSVSVNDFVVKAAALALRAVPEANVRWDGRAEGAVAQRTVDISVAVATERGLITPIVARADTLSVVAVNAVISELAARARANRLKPEEFIGGTFTISNLGMYGIDEFSAVINPPQARGVSCAEGVGVGGCVCVCVCGGGGGHGSLARVNEFDMIDLIFTRARRRAFSPWAAARRGRCRAGQRGAAPRRAW